MKITLPYNWAPREYQTPLWNHLTSNPGEPKRACVVWPRRSGKDSVALNFLAYEVMRRPGTYWYLLPQQNMARRSMWAAVDDTSGIRRIHQAFPREIIRREIENEMFIEFQSGSTLQFIGSDAYDSLVGSPPVCCVFSEAALSDERAWAYTRPILLANRGTAIFLTTPRGAGDNFAYKLYETAKADPGNWFCEKRDATQIDVYTKEQLDAELKEMQIQMGAELGLGTFNQEYMCSFNSPISGAYFGEQMDLAEKEQRITNVPYDPTVGCFTSWDLGISDQTVILILQICGQEIHVIDMIDGSGQGLDYYVRLLKNKPYVFNGHVLPHDIQVRELTSGKSRLDTLRTLGLSNMRVVPAANVADGIQSIRSIFPKLWFDQKKCKKLIEALRAYHRSWSEKLKTYADHPVHDWSSHYCDALRMYAQSNVRNVTHRPIVYSDKGIV